MSAISNAHNNGNGRSRTHRKPSNQELKCRKTYCPEYDDYSRWSRVDLQRRDVEHSRERKGVFEECVYASFDALLKILHLHFGDTFYTQYLHHKNEYHICSKCSDFNCKVHPTPVTVRTCVNCEISYKIPSTLMSNLLKVSQKFRDEWSGVQISQCKKRRIDSYQEFVSKAINHQDQNSWQFIGKYLYVPAMDAALEKFKTFVDSLPEKIKEVVNGPALKHAIYEQLCCGLVYFMMDFTTRFKRTKPKALVRSRTLFRSQELRDGFLKCNEAITVDDWIAEENEIQRDGRKDSNGIPIKRNICEAVHNRTKHQCCTLFEKKLRTVCNLLNIQLPVGFVDKIIHSRRHPPSKRKKQRKAAGKRKRNFIRKNSRGKIVEIPVITGTRNEYQSYMNRYSHMNNGGRRRNFQNTIFSGHEKRIAQQMNRRQNSRQSMMNKYRYNIRQQQRYMNVDTGGSNHNHIIRNTSVINEEMKINKNLYSHTSMNDRRLNNRLYSAYNMSLLTNNSQSMLDINKSKEGEELLLSDECTIPEMASVSSFTNINTGVGQPIQRREITDEMTERKKNKELLCENEFLKRTLADASQFLHEIQVFTDVKMFLPPNLQLFQQQSNEYAQRMMDFNCDECTGNFNLPPSLESNNYQTSGMPYFSDNVQQNGECGMDSFGTCFEESLGKDSTVTDISVVESDVGSNGCSSAMSARSFSGRLSDDIIDITDNNDRSNDFGSVVYHERSFF